MSMKLDSDAVQKLKESFEKVGQFYSIIGCKQHPDFIIAGRHRKAAGGDQIHLFDVDAKCKKLGIPHDLAHIVLRQHLNVQRIVPEDERREELLEMAKIIEAQGVEKSKVAGRLVLVSPLSYRYIRELLPDAYKQIQFRPSGGGTGSTSDTELVPHPSDIKDESKREPYSKGLSPSQREHLRSETSQEGIFQASLSRYGIHYRVQEEWVREGEFTRDGKPKTYRADVYLYNIQTVLEVEGEGSSSRENEERDAFFEKQGIRVAHLSNELVQKHSGELAELIAALVR